jgi:hypothetical protein
MPLILGNFDRVYNRKNPAARPYTVCLNMYRIQFSKNIRATKRPQLPIPNKPAPGIGLGVHRTRPVLQLALLAPIATQLSSVTSPKRDVNSFSLPALSGSVPVNHRGSSVSPWLIAEPKGPILYQLEKGMSTKKINARPASLRSFRYGRVLHRAARLGIAWACVITAGRRGMPEYGSAESGSSGHPVQPTRLYALTTLELVSPRIGTWC